jgi:hypothetical protein
LFLASPPLPVGISPSPFSEQNREGENHLIREPPAARVLLYFLSCFAKANHVKTND